MCITLCHMYEVFHVYYIMCHMYEWYSMYYIMCHMYEWCSMCITLCVTCMSGVLRVLHYVTCMRCSTCITLCVTCMSSILCITLEHVLATYITPVIIHMTIYLYYICETCITHI